MALQHKVDGIDGSARATTVTVAHGSFRTPVFMPVGTKGAIKAVSSLGMESKPIECEILLGNTYHLADNPGAKVLEKHRGLHNFMSYKKNVLTDSGGFQMVSLLKLAQITEEGVRFQSPHDGSLMMLTPEESIRTQHSIGTDIIMALDDVVHSLKVDVDRFEEATDRTVRWLDRCIVSHLQEKKKRYSSTNSEKSLKRKNIETSDRQSALDRGYKRPPSFFAIVQGWLDCKPNGMRNRCLDKFLLPDTAISTREDSSFIVHNKEVFPLVTDDRPYSRDDYIDGYAIGGLAGGESKEQFVEVVYYCCQRLPKNKPRYLMGVGYPVDIVVCVCLGVDMFDCVYPTRTARFGTAFSRFGLVRLKSSKCASEYTPIDTKCACNVCRRGYSRACLNYLLKSCPSKASALITHHNLVYMLSLTRFLRESIMRGDLEKKVQQFFSDYFQDNPIPDWCVNALEKVNIRLT